MTRSLASFNQQGSNFLFNIDYFLWFRYLNLVPRERPQHVFQLAKLARERKTLNCELLLYLHINTNTKGASYLTVVPYKHCSMAGINRSRAEITLFDAHFPRQRRCLPRMTKTRPPPRFFFGVIDSAARGAWWHSAAPFWTPVSSTQLSGGTLAPPTGRLLNTRNFFILSF